MELLSWSPLRLAELVLLYGVFPVVYVIYFSRRIRANHPVQLHRLTRVTTIIGLVLPLIDIVAMLIGFIVRFSIPYVEEVSMLQIYDPYLVYLIPVGFLVCTILLYVRKTYPGGIILTIWSILFIYNASLVVVQMYAVVVWTPPVVREGLNVFDQFVMQAEYVSREHILFNAVLPLYWTTLSGIAACKAFLFRAAR